MQHIWDISKNLNIICIKVFIAFSIVEISIPIWRQHLKNFTWSVLECFDSYGFMVFLNFFLSWNFFLSKLSKILFIFLEKFVQKFIYFLQLSQEFSDLSLRYKVFNRDLSINAFLKLLVISLLLIARNGFLLMEA